MEALASAKDYVFVRHGDDADIVAIQARRPIRRQQFLSDVTALAARLPARKYVFNLCADRYLFLIGFAAAMHCEQISILPPDDAPGTLEALAREYPDSYAFADGARPPFAAVIRPESFAAARGNFANPVLRGDQPALVLFTSGSTGRPKPVPKSWGVLVRSAQAAGMRLGATKLRSAAIIGTVPHQHSYGLESTILLAVQHRLTLVAERPFYPADIRAAIEVAPRPRILVTTPVHLRSLVAEPDAMPGVDLIVSATAPLSVELAARAETHFGAPLVEIYGCTEAGQVATRRTVQELQWHCLDGVVLHEGSGGNWVDGAAVEAATELQDVIERIGAGEFLLAGRSPELVDIAGKHTSLAHLNHQLLSIAGVKDGAFVMPDPDMRRVSRLVALVVAPELPADAILRALRERVDPAFLPRPLILVEALPRNALGKLPREVVARLIRQHRCA